MNADVRNDLDRLISIAESGARAPLIGGRYLLLWGGLSALACLAHGAVIEGWLPLDLRNVGLVWLIYGVVGGTVSAFLGRGLAAKPGAASAGNRVARAAWTAVALGIFAYVMAILAWTLFFGAPVLLFDSILTIAFFGYAFAFAVTAALAGQNWLYLPSALSIAAAAVTPLLYGSSALYFVSAGGIAAAAILPGLVMVSREPKAVS